jgi:hypothetical protein
LKYPWDGSALDWSFRLPIRDTLAFRLRTAQTDESGSAWGCQLPAESPLLRAVPAATDTAASAYEPNESEMEAASIPLGRWIEAAFDFRASGGYDQDYYRFQAPAGSRMRIALRNIDTEVLVLVQDFSPGLGGISPDPGTEMTGEYPIGTSGEHAFRIYSANAFGWYSFRIDVLP